MLLAHKTGGWMCPMTLFVKRNWNLDFNWKWPNFYKRHTSQIKLICGSKKFLSLSSTQADFWRQVCGAAPKGRNEMSWKVLFFTCAHAACYTVFPIFSGGPGPHWTPAINWITIFLEFEPQRPSQHRNGGCIHFLTGAFSGVDSFCPLFFAPRGRMGYW